MKELLLVGFFVFISVSEGGDRAIQPP